MCNWRFWSFQSLPTSIGFLRKLQILYADENFLEGIPLEVCIKMAPYSYLLDECHVMFALACQQAPKWGHTWFVSLTNFLFCPTPFRHLFASYFCIKFLKGFFVLRILWPDWGMPLVKQLYKVMAKLSRSSSFLNNVNIPQAFTERYLIIIYFACALSRESKIWSGPSCRVVKAIHWINHFLGEKAILHFLIRIHLSSV